MVLINFVTVAYMLRLSPLRFIRRDLKTSKRKKAMRLPRFKFLARFRLRVLLQNIPNYLVLFAGIYFVVFLMTFAFGLPTTLDYYKEHATEDMFAKYQYVLKSNEDDDGDEITTKEESAEKFSMETLYTTDGKRVNEPISIYGVDDDSHFIPLNGKVSGNEALISSAYADKFNLAVGDSVTLKAKYTDDEYTFKIVGTYDYISSLALFTSLDGFNEIFGNAEGSFNGFLSEEEIKDIDAKYIAMTITEDDIMKVSNQLDHSMGNYMSYFKVICLAFAGILIYLLTKVIVEKNENSISMTKILGYYNGEIASLYLLTTTVVVAISAIISAVLGTKSLELVWNIILYRMDGWLPAYVPVSSYVYMVLMVLAAYLIVMFIDYHRIKKIPMDQALKNVE